MSDYGGKGAKWGGFAAACGETLQRVELHWQCSDGGRWLRLEDLLLDGLGDVFGVYVIWHGSVPSRYLRVGQGVIRNSLSTCCGDPEVAKYARLALYATWAVVAPAQADGVETFLAQNCNPLVGERFAGRKPIAVNLPFPPPPEQSCCQQSQAAERSA